MQKRDRGARQGLRFHKEAFFRDDTGQIVPWDSVVTIRPRKVLPFHDRYEEYRESALNEGDPVQPESTWRAEKTREQLLSYEVVYDVGKLVVMAITEVRAQQYLNQWETWVVMALGQTTIPDLVRGPRVQRSTEPEVRHIVQPCMVCAEDIARRHKRLDEVRECLGSLKPGQRLAFQNDPNSLEVLEVFDVIRAGQPDQWLVWLDVIFTRSGAHERRYLGAAEACWIVEHSREIGEWELQNLKQSRCLLKARAQGPYQRMYEELEAETLGVRSIPNIQLGLRCYAEIAQQVVSRHVNAGWIDECSLRVDFDRQSMRYTCQLVAPPTRIGIDVD